MGNWEKNLIVMIIRFIFRWIMSNEKNNKTKPEKNEDQKK